MPSYLCLGKYSVEGVKAVSRARRDEVERMVQAAGGKILQTCALLGPYDLAVIIECADAAAMANISVGISKLTGMGLLSMEMIDFEEFLKSAEGA